METIDGSFALLMQALLKQKEILDELDRENQELHGQLADLRAGVGISIDILGQQFPLAVTDLEKEATQQTPAVTYQTSKTTMPEIPETPAPERAVNIDRTTEDFSPSPSSTFLQELITNEPASATTSPKVAWRNPVAQSPTSEEEEKAVLRRQLTGSFLLE